MREIKGRGSEKGEERRGGGDDLKIMWMVIGENMDILLNQSIQLVKKIG